MTAPGTESTAEGTSDRVAGAERIAAAFASHGRQAALMPYLMGGFPDVETSLAIGLACADGGADIIELGVPYSDPLADGPVIHEAGTAALEAGTSVQDVLGVAERLAPRLPVVLMCYANLVYAQGVEEFAASLAERGVSGLIVPDLPLEEAPALRDACDAAGVALVALVAPTTPEDRLAAIAGLARGFLYAVSVAGTTGERTEVDVSELVERARRHSSVPVAVGFGIAAPEQAVAVVDAGAEGVIVGSRLVRAAGDAHRSGEDAAARVRTLVGEFADALKR